MSIAFNKQINIGDVPKKYQRALKAVGDYLEAMKRQNKALPASVQLYRQDWNGINDSLPDGVSLGTHQYRGVWLNAGDSLS